MKEVFVIGAGFSKAISHEMPLLVDLSQEVGQHIKLPSEAVSLGNNLELWLSYLYQTQPWLSESENLRNRSLALDISGEVAKVIEQRTALALDSICPQWLYKLLSYWHKSKAHIISLNYDVLIESAAAKIQDETGVSVKLSCENLYPVSLTPAAARDCAVLGGEPCDTLKLYKLHGSTNWFYSGRSSFFGETIVYIPVMNWSLESDQRKEEERNRKNTLDKVPLIIPPLFDKVPYFEHETIRSLWSQAGAALRESTRIYCIGYSLPQTDVLMQMLLKTNIRGQCVPLVIVNTDQGITNHYKEIFRGSLIDIQDSLNIVCDDAVSKFSNVISDQPT